MTRTITRPSLSSLAPLSAMFGLVTLVTLVACVTVNVYFPASATEKAADRIIDDVWGPKSPPPAGPAPKSDSGSLFVASLDFVLPPAEAAEPNRGPNRGPNPDPNIDVSSPEIKKLTASMEARHASLLPHFTSGAIGLTADGLVASRDPNLVPLAGRNTLRGLVADENADRQALYRQIAVANGHAEWEADIRKVFAARWIARASGGWWYQDPGGAWKQK